MNRREPGVKRCPTCGERIAFIFLSAGEYTYQPCGCPVDELDAEE